MARSPRAPFSDWPHHFELRGIALGWVCLEPKLIATQTFVELADPAGVHRIQDWLDDLAETPFVLQGRRPLILHDFRSVARAAGGVREAWLERAKRPGNPFQGSTAYCALNLGLVGRMMANTVALALQLSTQSDISIVDDPASVLSKYRVGAPPHELPRDVRRSRFS
ncbi:MAG: hypothetical protein R3B07_12540 [Polyangiaceae bacterium]